MTAILRWEDPPETINGSVQRILAELREQPGRWALVYENLSEHVAYNRARYLRKGGAECAVRKADDGQRGARHPNRSVWACWPEGA